MKFALIGCGKIGQTHAKLMGRHGNVKAVCDIEQAKADHLAQEYSANAYTDHRNLLASEADLDVVVVCTPNGLHAIHSVAVLNAGRHVLCEKPMALTGEDCRRMIEASEVNNKCLFVVKQNRYNAPVIALKSLLEGGKLGPIFSAHLNCFWNRDISYYEDSWRGSKDLDGGTLFTQFSHFIDLLIWCFGEVADIQGTSANMAHQGVIEFEDTGNVILHFHSGVVGTLNFTVNAYEKNMEGSLTVFGKYGTVKIGGEYLNILEYQNIKDFVIPDLGPGGAPNSYGRYNGSMSNHDKVYDNVVNVLAGRAAMTTLPHEGLKTVELINRIYQVIRKPA